MATVLIADDEADIRGLLKDYLTEHGITVVEAGNGPEAVEAFARFHPDLVILDVMMPGFDGFEVCRRIRQISQVPIIFLTARGDELDQLLGFGFGADDYVVKPFSPRTLVARVNVHLKRLKAISTPEMPGGETLVFGDLCIYPDAFSAAISGEELALTSKEFQLLLYLARHAGKVLTKRQLVTGAWGEEYFGDDSALLVHLSHLRQKLDDGGDTKWIRTVRGVGYKFASEQR